MKKGILAGMFLLAACTGTKEPLKEVQLTFDDTKNHDLDNNDNFSPDDKWLVFDTRTGIGGIGGSPSVERVNIETGKTEVLFAIPDNRDWGPGAGAASYHPTENKVIFIHGLPICTEQNPYQQWRRTGVIVDADNPNVPIYMDSRDVTYPFTAGALRGGTHRHEWSRDGQWVGYTYNDAIMKHIEDSTGVKWNLRTVAVSNKKHKALVDKDPAQENVQGEWYSAVVVRVVPDPKPGSDEISNAASDSWVGAGGYAKSDGKMQVARAFIGTVRDKQGKPVDELFIVDIPDSINVPGEYGSLEGTRTSFPMPPKGTVQRRLTHTADTSFPGCGGVTRSSSDGKWIAFQSKDKNGIQQVFLMSPEGGEPTQLTQHETSVQSGVRWSPDNKSVIYVWDNSIVQCEVSDQPFENRFKRLTAKSAEAPSNIVWSNNGKIIAFNRILPAEAKEGKKQIFYIRLN
jgi:Periplasmic component of the Tol biopolymer transport system